VIHHVHWWLVALSFFVGLGVTLALLVKGESAAQSEAPTTKIPAPKEAPTAQIPVAKEAPTTTIPAAEETATTKIPAVPYAPYGPGSARAGAEGSGPAGWLVKGRLDTRLYYTPDDATYDRTVAQVWFRDEGSAMRAYFTPWRKSSQK
jgi:uncharacterized membrane protein ArfC